MKTELKFFSKLHVRISLTFLLFSLSIILLLSGSIYHFTSDMLIKNDIVRTRTMVNQTGEYISSYLKKLGDFSNIIAEHKDIKSALAKSSPEALESISSLIHLAKEVDKNISAVAVISKNGFAITGDSDMSITLSEDMMDEEWYKKALASNRMPMLSKTGHSAFASDKGAWTISVYREITGQNNEHLGVVLIDISYNFIEDYIKNLDFGKSGYVYIMSETGDIIYHPNEDIFTDTKKSEELKSLMDGDITDGKVVYEGIINNSSWKLFGVASSDNLKILQKNLTKNILILSCILIILSLFIGIIASKILSEPITRLKIAMIDMDKKWTHIKISTDITEVSELENEYNRLIDRIKALTENITKEEKARRVFELKMLQSQINPHFLYNTLDTILWLSELNENEAVIKVTSALGKLLRFSLSTDLDFVSIKDEIEHVKNYLEIQKIRYEDMLVYEIDSIDNLKDAFIPKLIIQPIVENAIYHGLRPNGGGKINISFESFDNDIIIIVSDNGKGFDTKKLKEDSPSDNKIYLGGIGIKNVDHRIKLLCGDNYGISIKSAPGMGTKVIIKLRENSS